MHKKITNVWIVFCIIFYTALYFSPKLQNLLNRDSTEVMTEQHGVSFVVFYTLSDRDTLHLSNFGKPYCLWSEQGTNYISFENRSGEVVYSSTAPIKVLNNW